MMIYKSNEVCRMKSWSDRNVFFTFDAVGTRNESSWSLEPLSMSEEMAVEPPNCCRRVFALTAAASSRPKYWSEPMPFCEAYLSRATCDSDAPALVLMPNFEALSPRGEYCPEALGFGELLVYGDAATAGASAAIIMPDTRPEDARFDVSTSVAASTFLMMRFSVSSNDAIFMSEASSFMTSFLAIPFLAAGFLPNIGLTAPDSPPKATLSDPSAIGAFVLTTGAATTVSSSSSSIILLPLSDRKTEVGGGSIATTAG